MATVEMPAWAVKTTQDAMAAAQTAHKATSEDTNTKVTSIKSTVEGLSGDLTALDDIAPLVATTGMADICIIDVTLNPASGTYEVPSSATEQAELLNGAYIAVHVDGLMNPVKAAVTRLTAFKKRFIIPATSAANEATIILHLGPSATCAYTANEDSVSFTAGAYHAVSLLTTQLSGLGVTTEIARVQEWDPTASSANSVTRLLVKTTGANGTRLHFGHIDSLGNFISDAGVKVSVWEVPLAAESLSDCTEVVKYGSPEDTDILTLLNVLGNSRVEQVDFVGDSATFNNKFVRFPKVYVKTTKETLTTPVMDANNEQTSTRSTEFICRWFCNTAADADYHLHSAFCRFERSGSDYTIRELDYCWIARYPIQHQSLTCGGVSRAIAVSRSDSSQEIGNTRAGFLDRCRAINHAQLKFFAPGETTTPYLTVAADADARAAGMIDLQALSLVEDLAFLLFGVNSQSGLRGVSVDTTDAKDQQKNGKSDHVEALGIKLGGIDPTSAAYNFNFLGIEGGTWSAPGCMFPNLTSFMERVTTTDAEGTVTSTTRNRYVVAMDKLDYDPATGTLEDLLAAGYRYVAFNIGGTTRVGMDNTHVMRDAKIFSADKAGQQNINYAGVDGHWQGGAPAAIATYSASATYAVGARAIYSGKLYECTTAVETAEAFDSEKWTVLPNETITARSAYMVARGVYRSFGSGLGAVSLSAYGGLASSVGYNWRSRVFLQPIPAGE